MSDEVQAGALATPLVNEIVEIFARLKKPWEKLNETQQEMFISDVKAKVHAHMNGAVKVIAAEGRDTTTATLTNFKVKGTLITATIEAVKSDDNLLAFGHALGTNIQAIFHTPGLIDDGSVATVKPDPDQPDLLPQAESDAGDAPEQEAAE